MNRTYNTLFMLVSVDGKISTGIGNERDFDKDYKDIPGIRQGIQQYYGLEKQTDIHSLNTGRVMAKVGVNSYKNPIHSPDVNFIIIDNSHLTSKGIENLVSNLNKLYLVTKNENHPAFEVNNPNLEIIKYDNEVDFHDLFEKLKTKYLIDRITIQSGGTLNSVFIRQGLIDELSLVYAPALVGGKDTSTLVDGDNLVTEEDLLKIRSLKLIDAIKLDKSYLYLKYKVNNI